MNLPLSDSGYNFRLNLKSQAEERITISGQIGLKPSNLTLPMPQSLATEFVLSSQHVARVTAALRRGWEGLTQSTIYFSDDTKHMHVIRKGHKLLNVCSVCFI